MMSYPIICRVCKSQLILGENWTVGMARLHQRLCRTCNVRHRMDYYLANRKRQMSDMRGRYRINRVGILEKQKKDYSLLISEVLNHYGGKCVVCGETNRGFLTLHHKNGDGSRNIDNYKLAKRMGYPDTLEILCWNCHVEKTLRTRREKAMINSSQVFPNVERWVSGKKKPFCKTCRIKLTPETATAHAIKTGNERCRLCSSKCTTESTDYYKRLVIGHFGGRCYCCGESRIDRLMVGHQDENGNKHRKELGLKGGNDFYRWLVDSDFRTPYRLRVECFNCGCGATYRGNGICPHNKSGVATIEAAPLQV